jgi:hypothetical protein
MARGGVSTHRPSVFSGGGCPVDPSWTCRKSRRNDIKIRHRRNSSSSDLLPRSEPSTPKVDQVLTRVPGTSSLVRKWDGVLAVGTLDLLSYLHVLACG